MNAFPSTCDVYRPFGETTPTATDVPCRLVPNLRTTGALTWTHYLDLPAIADVRDGCTRGEGAKDIVYADGDEVRVDDVRYVVVWVEVHNRGTAHAGRRAYLVRHEAAWPDI